MTDETFISEKTGKRYRQCTAELFTKGTRLIEEIIEPKLELNDWYVSDSDNLYKCDGSMVDQSFMSMNRVVEIRKASGEVWKKINGEWVKI